MNTTNKGFGRISIPLVTPFQENEEVNYEVYEQLIDYVIEHNCCDSVISTGTTGEASALTFDERVKLFETAKKAAAADLLPSLRMNRKTAQINLLQKVLQQNKGGNKK